MKIGFVVVGAGSTVGGWILTFVSGEYYEDYYAYDLNNPTYTRKRQVVYEYDSYSGSSKYIKETYSYYDSVKPD